MLRSFKLLASEPGAPLRPQPANARNVVAWLQAAQVKLHDAQQTVVSAGTRLGRCLGCGAPGLLGRSRRAGLARHQR